MKDHQLSTAMTRSVAIWLRVSSEDQKLDSQSDAVERYVEARGWDVTARFIEQGVDGGRAIPEGRRRDPRPRPPQAIRRRHHLPGGPFIPDRLALAGFKEYPPEATPTALLEYLERERVLRSIGTAEIDVEGTSAASSSNTLAEFVDRYDVRDLRRFSAGKRHAVVACFLLEAHRPGDYAAGLSSSSVGSAGSSA